MNKSRFLAISMLAVLIFSSISCDNEEFVQVTDPDNIGGANFFQKVEDLNLAVIAAYTGLSNRGMYKRQLPAIEYLNGDFQITAGGFQFAGLNGFQFTSNEDDIIGSVWQDAFRGVARCNIVLERGPEIPAFSENEDLKPILDRSIAEVRFLRGLYYFHLVSLYGDVPLLETAISGLDADNFKPSRTSADQIWDFIEADLTFARDNLPKKGEYSSENVGRATAGAAQGYLGKAHLYQKDYAAAAAEFKKLLATAEGGDEAYGTYSLMTNFEENFLEAFDNNDESLFEVQFAYFGAGNIWAADDNGSEPETNYAATEFSPIGAQFANAYPSDEVNAFFVANDDKAGDRHEGTILRYGDDFYGQAFNAGNINSRITDVVGTSGARGNTGVKKWTLNTIPFGTILRSGNNMRLLRYSDVMLMYAEAENEVNGPSAALTDLIVKLRNRANATDVTVAAGSRDEFRETIKTERRLELTFEFVRYFDLLRWDEGTEMPGFVAGKNELLPIPQREIDLNENLAQNPGF